MAIALAYISAIAIVVGWFVLRGDSEAIASVPLYQQEPMATFGAIARRNAQ